ncbi:MAG: pyrimidine-nucleoside phosphorylase [Clostridiales bacterium]|jgi:pyrimidine-nucleoside phosphorylase|nr:pyrimidine-nucleoside phosphorylase [Clostridiales bacterium]MDK2932618.1 pyrimidine-nucleoside phosphorylase [Clostridiales bacterium]
MYDIIAKKRDGIELTKDEISFSVKGYTNGNIPDYQFSALLMAIFLRGMNKRETVDLTMAMVESGDRMDLSSIDGIKVDKHSTGGVGDKTTLVLAPLVAAAGIPVAKMSGRGLGHTGGTIDKLESIPGFNTQLDQKNFLDSVKKINIAIAGQTGNLVPADKKIYALRDVTATVNNISLIASSIMSKKIAAGSDAILLDVKTGNGAFMKDIDAAFNLAQEMVDIGKGINKEIIAVISDMNQPLGYAIGNSLEVIEAIETLKGVGPQDLTDLCITLGAYMLMLGKKVDSIEAGKEIAKNQINSGKALKKLSELIESQNGNKAVINNYDLLPKAKYITKIYADFEGYVEHIDTEKIGIASLITGAGRVTKESAIDLSAGIILHKKVGDRVFKEQAIATIYANDKAKIEETKQLILSSYYMTEIPVKPNQLIYGIVTKEGMQKF